MKSQKSSTYCYHKSLDTLSIFRYNLLRKSIENEQPDYRHILVLDKFAELPNISSKLQFKLQKTYEKMLGELPEVNIEVLRAWSEYFASYLRLYKDRIVSSLNEMKGENNTEINYIDNNRLFAHYINVLNDNYTNFEILEYYISNNLIPTFKKHYPDIKAPKELKLLQQEIKAFYTITRYYYEVDQLKIHNDYKKIFKSDQFMDAFIKAKIIKIDDLQKYVERLSHSFKLADQYDLYIELRFQLFSLEKLKCEFYQDYDFYKELVNLKQITKINIDPFTTSVSEYMRIKIEAREYLKKQETKN